MVSPGGFKWYSGKRKDLVLGEYDKGGRVDIHRGWYNRLKVNMWFNILSFLPFLSKEINML